MNWEVRLGGREGGMGRRGPRKPLYFFPPASARVSQDGDLISLARGRENPTPTWGREKSLQGFLYCAHRRLAQRIRRPQTRLRCRRRCPLSSQPKKFEFGCHRSLLGTLFYLRRSRQIRERKVLFFFLLLVGGAVSKGVGKGKKPLSQKG